MASSNVSSFLSIIGQGVKPNMFNVDIDFPAGFDEIIAEAGAGTSLASALGDNSKVELASILCKSAALPGSNLGVIEVPFRGCLLYTSPSPRDLSTSRMPSSA